MVQLKVFLLFHLVRITFYTSKLEFKSKNDIVIIKQFSLRKLNRQFDSLNSFLMHLNRHLTFDFKNDYCTSNIISKLLKETFLKTLFNLLEYKTQIERFEIICKT